MYIHIRCVCMYMCVHIYIYISIAISICIHTYLRATCRPLARSVIDDVFMQLEPGIQQTQALDIASSISQRRLYSMRRPCHGVISPQDLTHSKRDPHQLTVVASQHAVVPA